MKRMIIAAVLVLSVILACAASAEEKEILIYTEFADAQRDVLEIGWVDSQGDIRLWTGAWSDADRSYDTDTSIAWMLACEDAECIGSLSNNELWDVKGLVACTEDRVPTWEPGADDAGCEVSYAVRDQSAIVLGGSGCDKYENTDPNAQALYLLLRELIPGVQNYFGTEAGPAGFQSVPVTEFCGYTDVCFEGGNWTRSDCDCECGPCEEISINGAPEFFGGRVTGKANCSSVTGNTTIYHYYDTEGKCAAHFEFYGGLLVTTDGMYYVEQ